MKELLKSLVPGADRHLKNLRASCGNRLCHNTQLMRSIPGSRPGIAVGDAWYCCVDCFVAASATTLERLSEPKKVMEMPRNPRLSLGLFLLSKGMLTPEQLREATAMSHRFDEDLEVTLIRQGLVGERQLAAARSAKWGYPMLAPGFAAQSTEIDLPREILLAGKAVPLHYSVAAQRIVLGFAERVEHSLIELIEEWTRCRVEPCIVTPTIFREQMEKLSPPSGYDEVVVEDPGPPEKMARTVGRVAVRIAAREASFGQWRHLVLVRVSGKRGKMDVVFRLPAAAGAGIGLQSTTFKEAIAV